MLVKCWASVVDRGPSLEQHSYMCHVYCIHKVQYTVPANEYVTPRIHTMLVQCWPSVYDAGPTLGQRLMFAGTGHISQQTRGIHPMPFQCWPTVFDTGPTLKQNWAFSTHRCRSGKPPLHI